MSERSRGIVLQHIRYGDTSLIVKVFTEQHGLQSFMIKGAYSRQSKFRPALFQPLTFIEYVSRFKASRDLQFMTEVGVEMPFSTIYTDVRKSSMIIFIGELLSKTIVESTPNQALFDFVHDAVLWLDLSHGKYADFHLHFCLELSRYLGFYPKTDRYEANNVFDLMNGVFRPFSPSLIHFIPEKESLAFKQLCGANLEQLEELRLNNETRRILLNHILLFYQLHVPGFKGMHSHEILKVVLS